MRRYLAAVVLGLAATPVSAQPAPPTAPAAPTTKQDPSKPARQGPAPSKPSSAATAAEPTKPNTPTAPAPAPVGAAPDTASPPPPGPSDAELLESATGSEVISVESKSAGQVLRESARAVTVVETKVARKRAADLGEVLSRTHGVQVRRDGGLGSFARFSLNGLYDDQVRFFLDGVPLELAGWGVGIANVPVDLLERVDIHRGVVPIALGADALGGAIDLVTDPSWVSRATASLEIGSFGTSRGAVTGRARDADTGLAVGLSAFADRALNNYPIRVSVPDEQGRLHEVSVRRFHDGYLAAGGNAELGIVDRGPVRRALVRLFASQYNKDLQHNLVMTVPYGEAGYGEAARGATGDLTLEQGPWHLRVLGGGAHRRIDYHDTSTKVYDWFGNAVRDRQTIGEVDSFPTYQVVTESSVFGRIVGDRALGDRQRLRVALAPTGTFRGGEDLILTGRGPIEARRNLTKLVSGIEHEWRTEDSAIQNVAFVKHYTMWTDADDVQTGNVFVPIKQRTQRFGAGDGVRWHALDWLSLKASYEYATRLPSVDELFGDGKLIDANLQLEPEVSHNGNLEVAIADEGRYGAISAQADVFVRKADRLILMIGNDRRFINQNVWRARIRGIEGGGQWTLPGERGWVEGSITLQDLRNASSEGLFGAYEGDRIPNRPWLLGSLGATARARDLLHRNDELLVFANSRYVHEFFRGWTRLGRRDSKQVIPSQLVHGAGVTYVLHGDRAYSGTLEIQNLTDTSAYDSYGVVRPGRGLYLKLGVEL